MSSQGYFHSIGIEGSRFQGHHSLGTGTHHLEREPSTLGHRNTDDSLRFSSTLFFLFLFVCLFVFWSLSFARNLSLYITSWACYS